MLKRIKIVRNDLRELKFGSFVLGRIKLEWRCLDRYFDPKLREIRIQFFHWAAIFIRLNPNVKIRASGLGLRWLGIENG